MAFNPNLREAMVKVARIVGTRLMLQAPVKTGQLVRSIVVEPRTNQIEIFYADHGTYTNYGTGRYYPSRFSYGTQPDPGTFRGYQKGKGGIRPQYWTAMSFSDANEIDRMIENELEKQTIIYLEGEIDDIYEI